MSESTLPLRPLTSGELMDAAVLLLRSRGWRLIALGTAAALAEQLVLFPLRRAADVDNNYLPGDGLWPAFWLMVAVGFGTEAFLIALLGRPAAAAAPRALVGAAAPRGLGRGRGAAVVAAALPVTLIGTGCWLLAAATARAEASEFRGLTLLALLAVMPLWAIGYGLLGLTTPAVVIDRLGPGRAVLRSLRLSTRGGLRVMWLRLLGYLAWFFIRLALGFAVVALIELVRVAPSTTWDEVFMAVAWLTVNAVAYPVLGCLDVALHVDMRMRTEGLDISLRRAVRRGVATDAALAVP